MKVHLFATDESAFRLIEHLPRDDVVTCIVYPSNRRESPKVWRLLKRARAEGYPVFEHRVRKPLPADLPPLESGMAWLYTQVILPEDLQRYAKGILNMHGGAIPEYRGFHIPQWAIVEGEKELGVTWHEAIAEVDAGPIWMESRIPIAPDVSAWTLRQAMIGEAFRLFPKAWARFRNKSGRPRMPRLDQGRVWPPRKPEDGRIGPVWPERRVRDMVRALCPPWPPAAVSCDGDWVFVRQVLEHPEPGTIPYRTAEGALLHLRRAGSETAP